MPARQVHHCWQCHKPLARSGDVLRCTTKACSITRVRHAAFAWTPLACSRGKKPQAPLPFLRSAYCYALRMPQDTARHFTGLSRKAVMQHWACHAAAAAWAERKHAEKTVFTHGVVESDGTRTGLQRVSDSHVRHNGRMLVMVARDDPSAADPAFVAMPDATVPRGAAPPPERYENVCEPVTRKLRPGTVHCTDGAQAFKKAAPYIYIYIYTYIYTHIYSYLLRINMNICIHIFILLQCVGVRLLL